MCFRQLLRFCRGVGGRKRKMNGGGNAAAAAAGGGGAVVMVAVDASKDMTDYALLWTIREVVRPKDALILVALLKSTPSSSSSGKVQSQAVAAAASSSLFDGSKFLGSLRKKLLRQKGSGKHKGNVSSGDGGIEHPRQCLGFEDEGVKWIYEVCLEMLSDLCCENDVEQVKALVKVVPFANISSVADIAEEQRADWVVLDRRLKKESECCVRRLNCNIITVNQAIPNLLKMVNTEERQEETMLLSLLTSTDDSSSATNSLTVSRSSTSSSEKEGSGSRGGGHPSMPAGIFAPWEPALHSNSTEKHQPSNNPISLPPGRILLDSVPRFKMNNPQAIKLMNEPNSLVRNSFNYRDTAGNTNSSINTQALPTQHYCRTMVSENNTYETETKPTSEINEFEDKSIGVATEPVTGTSTSALPTSLNRTSSIRRAMSISIKQPRAPPPLCSVCRHNAPEFGKPPRMFSYKEMEIATDGFSRKNFLAEGGYGPVYRGLLDGGQVVAVKKRKEASAQGAAEFRSEVEVLSCAQHRNLVMLVGYCVDKNEWMLVYEFACNDSLDKHLHGKDREVMAWKHRQKVAIGTARGLRYLHEDCRVGCIVHRDLRPNNILLTHDFEAMVGDFGLARWQMDGQSAEETRIVGTLGYLAPEYTQTGQITEKADVYSLGVLMMELITGVKAIDLIRRGMHLHHWATPLIEKMNIHKLIDPRLKGRYDKQEVERMMLVAGLCVSPKPEIRPRISKVLRLLEGDMESFRASQTQIRSSISEYTDSMSQRLSKILNPISRSAHGGSHSRSLTPPSSRYRNGNESDRRSKTPPPPSRFSGNPSHLNSTRHTSRLSSRATHQQYQAPTTSIYNERTSRLRSQTPPFISTSNMNLSTSIRTSNHFQEFDFVEDMYDVQVEEEIRSNNVVKPTRWMQTHVGAIQEMEDFSNRDVCSQDDLTSREHQVYLEDSIFQFIQNTKGTTPHSP